MHPTPFLIFNLVPISTKAAAFFMDRNGARERERLEERKKDRQTERERAVAELNSLPHILLFTGNEMKLEEITLMSLKWLEFEMHSVRPFVPGGIFLFFKHGPLVA